MTAAGARLRGENIVLIGFMGSGKTSTGQILAAELGCDFIDTDALVVAAMGMAIPAIFAKLGEAAFRAAEKAAVAEAAASQRAVIATGGGAVLDQENVRRLKASGTVVWLDASPDAIMARVSGGAGRPLFPGGLEALERMLASRRPHYRAAADLIVDTTGQAPAAVAALVREGLGR